MNVYIDGWNNYQIHDLSKDDMECMLRMIASACLNERRQFDTLKEKIKRVLEI